MSLVSLSNLGDMFGFKGHNDDGLYNALLELQGLKFTVIAGGSAGNHTVTGIATEDTLVAVLHLDLGGNAETDLTSEFSISAANTINNTSGTDTSSDTLLVMYFDKSGH